MRTEQKWRQRNKVKIKKKYEIGPRILITTPLGHFIIDQVAQGAQDLEPQLL